MQVLGSHCICPIANLEKGNTRPSLWVGLPVKITIASIAVNHQYQRGNLITIRHCKPILTQAHSTSASPDMWPKTPRADAGPLTPGTSRCSRRLAQ
ncbi:hypothetical protein CORC01_03632 [Colletotrichum orchidophilum]|uniref:Uncharacterized protein n=1 Tax=Colletotrichum orchidophilum TaxID=1209926 RepID=A0A1G4BI62_9PEZI|nr:uncharacterized protein CORC01_03632 [Colletotrichum orchidophilum]OHF01065.1 hypothetical protein CORC01_03632 [Colletotrichum orchidophilum]